MPKIINATGTCEYTLKDLYHHLHVGNIVYRCQSATILADCFNNVAGKVAFRFKKKHLV
jgi:hypothetical protein